MTDKVKTATTSQMRAKARLAEALRANLAKRKTQARARHRDADDMPVEAASPSPQNPSKGEH